MSRLAPLCPHCGHHLSWRSLRGAETAAGAATPEPSDSRVVLVGKSGGWRGFAWERTETALIPATVYWVGIYDAGRKSGAILFGSIILEPALNGLPSGGPFRFPRRKSRSTKGICNTRLPSDAVWHSAPATLCPGPEPAAGTAGTPRRAPKLSVPLCPARRPS
jgi:hypothetical protein